MWYNAEKLVWRIPGMNEYLKNLNKIEFAVTTACTGRCRHCQNGEQSGPAEHIDAFLLLVTHTKQAKMCTVYPYLCK